VLLDADVSADLVRGTCCWCDIEKQFALLGRLLDQRPKVVDHVLHSRADLEENAVELLGAILLSRYRSTHRAPSRRTKSTIVVRIKLLEKILH